jgi:predicted DNA binding protein
VHEISFRLKHQCPFGKLSEQFPNVTLSNWCNFAMEVLEYQAKDPELAARIQSALAALSKRGFKVVGPSVKTGTSRMVLMRCGHKRGTSVDEVLEDHGCLVLYPVVYRDGWEHYRVVALDDERVGGLFDRLRALGEMQITLKRRSEDGLLSQSFILSTGELFSGLTAKQAGALHAAIEHGYYRVPRRIRTEDIARSRKVPRTTFEEHVRKAESKILQSMAPYIALYAESAR